LLPCCCGAAQPNIVLIISDDAGFADFGFMDAVTGNTTNIPTPELDRLRSEGVLFTNAYTGSVCSPSRAAITTGFYQNRLGYEFNTNNLTSATARDGHFPETVTIFEWMKALGYTTGAIGKWHIGAMADDGDVWGNRPERQGVDDFLGQWGGSRTYTGGAATSAEHVWRHTTLSANGTVNMTVVENIAPWKDLNITDSTSLAAENFIEANHGDPGSPFFLYVSFTAPHTPLHESPDFNDPRISGLSGNRKQYASMMITLDKAIGRIHDRLLDPDGNGDASDSIKDDTLIIFINDNGGPTKNSSINTPLRGSKGAAYEGGIRVPMFMTGVGLPEGGAYHEPIHSIDIVPTIARLAGANSETTVDGVRLGNLDGVDLRPFIAGTTSGIPHEKIIVRKEDRVSIRKGNWKMVGYGDVNAFALYDLATNIGENINRRSAEPAILADMIHELNVFDATSDKPRHAALQDPPDAINLNDRFIASPPAPVGDGFNSDLTIVGGSLLNGNFDASTTGVRDTFQETPNWTNIGEGSQSQPATHVTLDYDGTRNGIIAETTMRALGLDTLYNLNAGDVLHLSYLWRDAADWEASDRVEVILFTTDNNTLTGNRTVIETVLSGASEALATYQPESYTFAPIPAQFAGKRLFMEIDAAQVGISFARIDNVVLERGTSGTNNNSAFLWSAPNRWKDGDTGNSDTLLQMDGFPGAILEFPSRSFDYTATNDLNRSTGLEFMLNTIRFTGEDATTISIDGKTLAVTADLLGNDPRIESSHTGGSDVIEADLLLFNDLFITGPGNSTLVINGGVNEESAPCSLIKDSPGNLLFGTSPSHTGGTFINNGTLVLDGELSLNGLSISSTLEVEAGAGALAVGDQLELSGATLELIVPGGVLAGNAHIIASYSTLSGSFANINGIPAGWHVDHAYHDGTHDRHIALVRDTSYTEWAESISGLSGPDAATSADPNGDGVSNGLAWFLGMENANYLATAVTPQLRHSAGSVEFTFNGLKEVSSGVFQSQELTNWLELLNGTDGVVIESDAYPLNTALETVTVRLPESYLNQPVFIRLEVPGI
jgi:autotransporter-associated beta strand protein